MFIIFGEFASNTQKTSPVPIYIIFCQRRIEMLLNQECEFSFVVQKPIQIIEPLVDDILIESTFVFDDYWTVIFIKSQCIDAAPVRFASFVLGPQEPYAQENFQVFLNKCLQRLLY